MTSPGDARSRSEDLAALRIDREARAAPRRPLWRRPPVLVLAVVAALLATFGLVRWMAPSTPTVEVTYAKGEREIFYFKDFASGAMIENIVSRAKKRAVKRTIEDDERGIMLEDLIESVNDEFKENEDLPNTTNPDDWARISGRKGERIINVRTLMSGISRKERSIENITSGQYL